ncbi:MAG: hypothetical protein QW502_01350 [Candidatus Bathyarchaeia archaeon]|nr:hypothetical protein [Candidatus Bathyarchaeota archaeon]
MKKTVALAALGLAALSAMIVSAYSVLAWYSGRSWMTGWVERRAIPISVEPQCIGNAQNFTWTFRRGWKWALGSRWGFKGIEIELSEGFKEKVLGISSSDEDVQNLLNEGYSVSDIKISHVKLVVQENGQITMEADKAMLILTKNGSRAFVEIDLKAEKVTKITIISITIIDKSTST